MRLDDLSLVDLDSIPSPPYRTPSENLSLVYAAAKRMASLCVKLNGMGLAAAQVGLPWNMFVVNPTEKELQCYFDCEYEPLSGDRYTSIEGCLSLPGQHYAVERHETVRVSGSRLLEGSDAPEAEPFSAEFQGVMAVLMQHEIDHQRGREKMIDRIGKKVVPV